MGTSDQFAGLSATGWTAIGSIVGAVSVIVLSVFNGLALRAANRAAGAANDQARAAQETLKTLKDEAHGAGIAMKATALNALDSVARSCLDWKGRLASDERGPVNLFPNTWAAALTFTLLRVSVVADLMYKLEEQIGDVQRQLNDYVKRDPIGRRIVTSEMRQLEENLERVANDCRVIADQLRGLPNTP